MTLIIRQLRALITETPLRQKKQPEAQSKPIANSRRKSLTVKISKEPPTIVYFERDHSEDSFECIFDPKVHHDDENDHPDLFEKCHKKDDLKPWQKPPYSIQNKSFMNKVKQSFSVA